MKIRFPVVVIFGCLLALSITFRLYQFAQLTEWWGDPGGDMLVARNILYNGHRPLVGPYLMVANFYTPPTYYYLLTFFLWATKTPLGVTFVFFILNLSSGILLAYLAKRLIDTTTGILTFFLYTFSSVMIIHSHSIYQPYPIQLFLVLSLYLLWEALSQHRLLLLVGSLFSFSIAASIYPSPWLLAPYVIFSVRSFFQNSSLGKAKQYSLIRAVLLTGLIAVPIYLPQFLFEARERFPTFTVLVSHIGGFPDAAGVLRMYAIYTYQLFNQFFGIESFVKPPYAYGVGMAIISVFILMLTSVRRVAGALPPDKAKLYNRALAFINITWVLLSMITMIVFWENAYHRLWVFFPIVFLLSSFCFRLALDTRLTWYRFCVGLIFCLYIIGNISATRTWITRTDTNDFAKTEDAVRYIITDVKTQKISDYNYGVLYYTTYGYGNYNLGAVLYFLQKDAGYPVRFLKAGNDIDRYGINTSTFGTVYLICRYFPNINASHERCRNKFLEWNPRYVLRRFVVLPLGDLYIFTRE